MRGDSVVAGRDRELTAVLGALVAEQAHGALLVGQAGVGKSRIIAGAADRLESSGWHVIRLRATTGSAEVPLGAFLGQLGPTERFLTPLIAELRQRVREEAGARPVLLMVDDIDLLDDSSTVLVHQLVAAAEVKLLATMRSGRLPASEIIDLWQRGELRRLEIGPFDLAGTAEVASAVLGAGLDETSVARLHQATEGNALFIREVLLATEEHGSIERADGSASIGELPVAADRLVGIVEARLSHLDGADREALLHIAFAEPCGRAEVAGVADEQRLVRLERIGLISTAQDGKRLVIHLSHPLYGEVLRAATPNLHKRRIFAALAHDLAATGARRRADRMKLARLAVDGGVSLSSELLVAAASTAYHNGDLVLAERIGHAAFAGDASFAAGWDLAFSLYQLGQIDQTRAHLARWATRATNDAEHRAVAMVAAQLEFWYVGDLAAAQRITEEALARHPGGEPGSPGASPSDLLGNLALFLALAGQVHRSLEIAAPLLDSGPSTELIRGALAVANAHGARGRFGDGLAQLDRAVQVFATIGQEAISLSERIFVSSRAVVNAWRGDLDVAEGDAYRARNASTNEFENAAAHFSSALLPMLRGRPSEAIPYAERAFAWWGPAQPGSTERRWALARLAWVHAEAGSLARAEATLRLFDLDNSPGMLFDHEAALARATVFVASGRPTDARTALHQAMATARRDGYVPGEIHLAYALVRLDRAAEVAARLGELAEQTESRLPRAFAEDAATQAAGDGAALFDVARTLGDIGCMRYATDAAAMAVEAAKRAGDQRLARRASAAVAEWQTQCEVPNPIVNLAVASHVPLTRREREIALLATKGLSNREIGERLYISMRTAENHLAKVYDKLGVRSRTELAELLDAL